MDEHIENLRMRIRLTEMMLEKRERAYHEATLHGTELQRMMRMKKYRETANELMRLKAMEERMMNNNGSN